MKKLSLGLLGAAMLWGGPESAERLSIPRLEGRPKIDGMLDEPVWSKAFVATRFFQTRPGENLSPSRKTEVRLFHNGSSIYLGVRCWDPRPQEIWRKRYGRDSDPGGGEAFSVLIDPSGSAQKALAIGITPMGDVSDGLYDLSTGHFSKSFDFEFKGMSRIDGDGYTVELEIPFDSLPIPLKNGSQTWYLYLERTVPRQDFELISNVPVNRESVDPKDSYAPADLEDVPQVSEKHWHFLPAVVASSRRVEQVEGADRAVVREQRGEVELTGWWSPSPSTVAKFTWNPDFSQVEADAPYQRVNNRFPVFIPEKRPFFLDLSAPFDTDLRLVHTRAIVEPQGGLRWTTNQGPWGLAALSALERRAPGERFGLSKEAHDTSWNLVSTTHASERGTYRLLGTSMEHGGDFNRVVSLSGNPRWGGVQWNLQAARSFSRLGTDRVSEGDAWVLGGLARPSREWTLSGEWRVLSPTFLPLAGFIPDVGVRKGYANAEWERLAQGEKDFFRRITLDVQAYLVREWQGETRNRGYASQVRFEFPHRIDAVVAGGEGSECFMGQRFRTDNGEVGLGWSERSTLQLGGNWSWGKTVVYDPSHPRQGRFRQGRFSIEQVFGWIGLKNQWTQYELWEEGGGWLARQHYWTSRVEAIFGHGMSLGVLYQWDRARWQEQDLENPTSYLQVLFQYRPSAFTRFYLGFNRSGNDQKTLSGQRWAQRVEDNIFMKLAYKF